MYINNSPTSSRFAGSLTPWSLLLPPVGVTGVLWLTRLSEVTPEGVLYAFVLFLIPWCAFLIWGQQKRGIPVFAMVGLVYWWFFAVGMFWLDRVMYVGRFGVVEAQATDDAMLLAVVGVSCLGAGMRIPVAVLQPLRQLELQAGSTSWIYLRWILVIGTLVKLAPNSSMWLGADLRQVIEILISTVPTTALILLLQRCLTDKGSKLDRALLWAYVPVTIVGALASGWVGSTVYLGLSCGATYLCIRGRIPWKTMAISLVALLFLQVGKDAFRSRYWYGQGEGGLMEKATFWVNGSVSKWKEALQGGDGVSARDLSSQTLQRTSLLTQVAHVLDMTPSQVPFQEGQTYSYLAITLIPRFVWPDKPSVNVANQYYQVAFGLTDPRDLDKVSIAVGCLAEAYINFGWYGVVGVMFVLGVLLGIYQRSFVSPSSSKFFLALGIALLPTILGIERQMAQYVGGVIQHILLTIFVFLPIIGRRNERSLIWRQTARLTPATERMRVRPNF